MMSLEVIRQLLEAMAGLPLSGYAKWVLVLMANRGGSDGTAVHPSIDRLVRESGWSERKIQYLLRRELEPLNFVTCDSRGGRGPRDTSRWHINLAIVQDAINRLAETSRQQGKKTAPPKKNAAPKSNKVPWPPGYALNDQLRTIAIQAGVRAELIKLEWQRFEAHAMKSNRRCARWNWAWREWCLSDFCHSRSDAGRNNNGHVSGLESLKRDLAETLAREAAEEASSKSRNKLLN
jgi:hypothetical protein